MTKNDLRIVFLGTPDFAVESLRRIVDGGYNVVGLTSRPDAVTNSTSRRSRNSPLPKACI
jgi:methionyl-tRNA formyltransferase